MGKFENSEDNYRKAIELLINEYGSDHSDLVNFYFNLGELSYKKKNLDEAKKYYEKTVDLIRNLNGNLHYYFIYLYNKIGYINYI